ncbi:MAG: hypothetical protein DLM58_05570 [Pseudonocardiales bacterium]|nr:MAG: hypothetical protein DLM58_05570 [Pseudonocardiales bacterium]
MATALEILGPHLQSLPDGETGERRNWVISIVDGLRAHPDLELRKAGDWSDYDKTPQLRVRNGRRLYGASLDFGHVAAVRDSFPQFEQARAAAARSHIVFQEGVPGDFDLAMFTLGPAGALRNRRPFTEATLAEIRDVKAVTGPQTLFQIEVPVELVLLAKAPAAARPALARLLARTVTGLAAAAPSGTRFAVHLCLGDMNNRAFGTMTDAGPLVLLANAILRSWPAGRPLDLIHAPFAAADQPATVDPAFYAPLRELQLPADVRFAAGFAHESQTLAEQRRIRTIIDDRLERRVAIASACGLGRRPEAAGRAVLERTAELCQD